MAASIDRRDPSSDAGYRQAPLAAAGAPHLYEPWIRGTRYRGIVKDISSGGVFVNTECPARTPIVIAFAADRGRTEIRVTGRIVRSERIRAHLAMQSALGIAVEVLERGALGRVVGDLRLSASEADGES